MNMTIQEALVAHQQLISLLINTPSLNQSIANAAHACISALHRGHKILLAGNGGSAADAQHIAAELVGRYLRERHGLPAIALTTDSSILTAVGNDYGYQEIFARQIQALGRRGDVLLAYSTSGNSHNILRALEVAQATGIVCVGLTGDGGGKMGCLCDHLLAIPSRQTPRIQEMHALIGHILCELIEEGVQDAGRRKSR